MQKAMKELHPHTKGRGTISNLILGVADGMIVSLAFLTGLSLNLTNPKIVILAGVSAVISNMISMFFGGILAQRTEIDLFDADYKRELYEIENEPEEERQELIDIYSEKGLSKQYTKKLVDKITKNKQKWLEDMLLNEVHIHKDSLGSPIQAGITIGLASLIGGCVPLLPYLLIGAPHSAVIISVGVSLFSLFAIGAVKGVVTKRNPLVSGGEMLLVGMVASLIVFGIGKVLTFA
jgi:predicted membrane protein (TIGR00267 family)